MISDLTTHKYPGLVPAYRSLYRVFICQLSARQKPATSLSSYFFSPACNTSFHSPQLYILVPSTY